MKCQIQGNYLITQIKARVNTTGKHKIPNPRLLPVYANQKPAIIPLDNMKYQIQGEYRITSMQKPMLIVLSLVSPATQGC